VGGVAARADEQTRGGLPRVVLVGDSTRQGHAPGVAKRLADRAEAVSPAQNRGDSQLRVGRDAYGENLWRIVDRLQQETRAAVVFASTTPRVDVRVEADAERYNDAAAEVMSQAGVSVHDLHWDVTQEGREAMIGPDGTHLSLPGNERLAETVAECVVRQIAAVRYRPLTAPPSGSEAQAYREAVAARDAQVPPEYRKPPVGEFRMLADAADCTARQPEVLNTVLGTLVL
jgi:hypothetical protein